MQEAGARRLERVRCTLRSKHSRTGATKTVVVRAVKESRVEAVEAVEAVDRVRWW